MYVDNPRQEIINCSHVQDQLHDFALNEKEKTNHVRFKP